MSAPKLTAEERALRRLEEKARREAEDAEAERAEAERQARIKAAKLEALREEERRVREAAEEAEVRELRRRAVPRANEVPAWYADMPKRAHDAAA